MRKIIIALVILITAAAAIFAFTNSRSPEVGGVSNVGGHTYYLAGSGISSSATSFTLTSFTLPQNDYPIADGDLSDTFYLTVEPGNRTRQEFISCTTVTQNAGGTATISGCTRGLSPISPYTASTSLQFAHSGGSPVILSNPPQFYEQFGALENDEAITGSWTAITPTAADGIAIKSYVDSVVNGGDLTLDGISIGATAGDTIAVGDIVYFDAGGSNRWELAEADDSTTYTNVLLGIAQGTSTDGNSIPGGVLTRGYDTTQTGLSAGTTYYLSDTAGDISTATGTATIILGFAKDTAQFYFNPGLNYAHLGTDNTFLGANTFNGVTTFTATSTGVGAVEYFTTSGTWSVPSNIRYAYVCVIGGGGGGGGGGVDDSSTYGSGGAGGGGGGLSCKEFHTAALNATTSIAITVGAGGAGGAGAASAGAGAPGSGGGTSKFGEWLQALGGSGGTNGSLNNTAAAGGAGGWGLTESGTAGGDAGTPANDPGVASTGFAPTGGGGAGNECSGDDGAAGGARTYTTQSTGTGGTGGGATGTDGSIGSLFYAGNAVGGTGGGGGEAPSSCSASGFGGNGGDGIYGSGGGGGAPSYSSNGGDGGDGGDGLVMIYYY